MGNVIVVMIVDVVVAVMVTGLAAVKGGMVSGRRKKRLDL